MFAIFRKRYFLLTFMGFGLKGNTILQEVTVGCRKITEAVIEEARKVARQKAKEAGVDVGGMCLVNSFKGINKGKAAQEAVSFADSLVAELRKRYEDTDK